MKLKFYKKKDKKMGHMNMAGKADLKSQDYLCREELEALQLKRLKNIVAHAFNNV